jgi:hypothetical protein
MSEYIAFDSHKRYTWVDRQDHSTGKSNGHRLEHAPGAVRKYLSGSEPGTAVAVEATGNWYWIIDEIEQAGLQPRLVHPRKAKLMMGQTNKTDKLEVMLDEKSSGRFAFFTAFHATFKQTKGGSLFDGVNNKGQGTGVLVNGNGPVSGFDINEKDGDTYKVEWAGECYSVSGPDGKPVGYCSGGGYVVPGSGTGRFAGLSGGTIWWGHGLPNGDFEVEGRDILEK